jgi:hypothetical protein
MKRFLMLVGVAVVAAAMYVAASPASQQAKGPTAKQFKTLKNQVAALGHTVKGLKKVVAAQAKVLGDCLQTAIPINQFGDPDGSLSGTPQGYDYGRGTYPGNPSDPVTGYTTGLDVTATSDTGSVWFVGAIGLSNGGTTCAADLAAGGNALRHAPAFVPHGR